MIQLNHQLQEEIYGFKHWIEKEFNVNKMSKKLEKYYELSVDEFFDELRKKKVDTKSRKNREYLEREFTESLQL
jgi:glycyl-tRNA synthetase beta subunit